MHPLLRYKAVCFSWASSTLYLGSLRSCRGGETPFKATLHSPTSVRIRPYVWATDGDGESLPILVDTGARRDNCKASLTQRQSGHPLRFGQHPNLETRCNKDNPPVPLTGFDFSAMIGMETLMKFSAFGWELNPFRMYFVPGPAVDTVVEPHGR